MYESAKILFFFFFFSFPVSPSTAYGVHKHAPYLAYPQLSDYPLAI